MPLSDEKIIAIRKSILAGKIEAAIARQEGVSRQAINDIKLEKTYPDIGPNVSHISRAIKRDRRAERAKQLALSGLTAQEVADVLKVSLNRVHLYHETFFPDVPYKRPSREGLLIPAKKLSFALAEDIRAERKAGCSAKALAEKYGVSKPTIYQILEGKRWTKPHYGSRSESI